MYDSKKNGCLLCDIVKSVASCRAGQDRTGQGRWE